MDNVNKIIVESASDQNIYPHQTANTLFHFVKKFDYLAKIIENNAIIPRYCAEDVDYLNIGYSQIAFPMICFCDIKLHQLTEHLSLYGKYGISFSKEWGINNNIQPIHYINPQSTIAKDYAIAFAEALNSNIENSAAENFLLTDISYFKPISGNMDRDGNKIFRIFTDEQEWRYIADVKKINLSQAITDENMEKREFLNKVLAFSSAESCWLKYMLNDIKYIIVNNFEECKKISQIIINKKNDDPEKFKLISKIIVWSDMESDL